MNIQDRTNRRKLRRRHNLKIKNYNQLPRLSIFRSCKNISAQIIDDVNHNTLVASSSLEKGFKSLGIKSYNMEGAKKIGEILAEKALAKNITNVIFDIGSYKYFGKVQTLIESFKEKILKGPATIKESTENTTKEPKKKVTTKKIKDNI